MKDETGFLYVVQYDNGLIKLGVAIKDADARIDDHDRFMRLNGVVKTRKCTSRKTSFPFRVEAAAIKEFSEFAVHGKEWLKEVNFEEVSSFINHNLIPVDCEERLSLLARREESSKALIASFEGAIKDTRQSRIGMALSYASAIEADAIIKGYSGALLEPSEYGGDKGTKLKAYATILAYRHTADDIASLLSDMYRDVDSIEQPLIEANNLANIELALAQVYPAVAA